MEKYFNSILLSFTLQTCVFQIFHFITEVVYETYILLVSSAAVIWVVTQRFSPTNGCLNPNPICFPLFSVHVKITECTNHALPIVSSETNHVSVCQFPYTYTPYLEFSQVNIQGTIKSK